MTDNKQTFELIFQEALKLARDDKEHEHYYSKRDFKFISLGKNEISEYLDNYEEGEDDEVQDDARPLHCRCKGHLQAPGGNDDGSRHNQRSR